MGGRGWGEVGLVGWGPFGWGYIERFVEVISTEVTSFYLELRPLYLAMESVS